METKEQLIKTIKDWVKLDNDIRKLQKEIKARKLEKAKTSNILMETMKKNEIDCFDINNGQICYTKKNVKKPITKKLLLDILSKYYKGDQLKASEINNFILENREETIKESIILKPIKN
jgi:ATP-dependent phosphoenolpyruvate carboxykinase